MNEFLLCVLCFVLGVVVYDLFLLLRELSELRNNGTLKIVAQPHVQPEEGHKSNFHKWNEELYYEMIQIIPPYKDTSYNRVHGIMLEKKDKLGFKLSTHEEYREDVDDVLQDLIFHQVVLSHEEGSTLWLQCNIPAGTDLFEYLRDAGVICNTHTQEEERVIR